MSIVDIEGNELTAEPVKKRTMKPRPGQVVVLRKAVDPYLRGRDGEVLRNADGEPLTKSPLQLQIEEHGNNRALVARTGPSVGEGPLDSPSWKDGDEVLIAPHLFTEVFLGAGDSLWIGPFVGIKAVFSEE